MKRALVINLGFILGLAACHTNDAGDLGASRMQVDDLVNQAMEMSKAATNAVPNGGTANAEVGKGSAYTCAPNTTCNVSCPEGKCKVTGGAGAKVMIDCPKGKCDVTCGSSGDCRISCPAGGCTYTCGAPGTCAIDCPGGGCVGSCGVDGTCSLNCPEKKGKKPCSMTCGMRANCACEGEGCKNKVNTKQKK